MGGGITNGRLQKRAKEEDLLQCCSQEVTRTQHFCSISWYSLYLNLHSLHLVSHSTVFDTVNHGILLNRLHLTIGLNDTALSWFKSYLTNRTEYISLGHSKSNPHTVTCGVPQGSVLGPILFILYLTPSAKLSAATKFHSTAMPMTHSYMWMQQLKLHLRSHLYQYSPPYSM